METEYFQSTKRNNDSSQKVFRGFDHHAVKPVKAGIVISAISIVFHSDSVFHVSNTFLRAQSTHRVVRDGCVLCQDFQAIIMGA